ncbi:hypothetical protein BS78_03G231200 [Paspalum vaginatum]|nr:hypothetical protein BS78_03G231200 [Paspalum vaginatum]
MLELLLVGCSSVVVLLHGASLFLRALFAPRHAVARPIRINPTNVSLMYELHLTTPTTSLTCLVVELQVFNYFQIVGCDHHQGPLLLPACIRLPI